MTAAPSDARMRWFEAVIVFGGLSLVGGALGRGSPALAVTGLALMLGGLLAEVVTVLLS